MHQQFVGALGGRFTVIPGDRHLNRVGNQAAFELRQLTQDLTRDHDGIRALTLGDGQCNGRLQPGTVLALVKNQRNRLLGTVHQVGPPRAGKPVCPMRTPTTSFSSSSECAGCSSPTRTIQANRGPLIGPPGPTDVLACRARGDSLDSSVKAASRSGNSSTRSWRRCPPSRVVSLTLSTCLSCSSTWAATWRSS